MLGCIQPISSAMMNRMLGFALVAACACALVTSPASKKLEMASAPIATFRTPAPKSMMNLLLDELLVGLHEGRVAMGGGEPIRGCHRQCSGARPVAKLNFRNERSTYPVINHSWEPKRFTGTRFSRWSDCQRQSEATTLPTRFQRFIDMSGKAFVIDGGHGGSR